MFFTVQRSNAEFDAPAVFFVLLKYRFGKERLLLLWTGARYLEEEKVGVAGEGEKDEEETNSASISSGGRKVEQLVRELEVEFGKVVRESQISSTTSRRFLSFSVSEKVAISMRFSGLVPIF